MKSWRDVLPVHPAADLFPLMSPDELRVLGKDIIKNGLTSYIVLWRADPKGKAQLLDGRNRLDAIEKATGTAVEDFLTCGTTITLNESVDPYAYVISANIHRRHLSTEQKRDLIAKLIKAQPEKSNRSLAKIAKVDHKTVGAVRDEQEARGEIPHVEERTDSKGRKQPAKKADPVKATLKRSKDRSRAAGRAYDARRARDLEALESEAGRVATKLIALNRDIAREVLCVIASGGDLCLVDALERELGPALSHVPNDPGASAEVMKAKHAALEDEEDAAQAEAPPKRGRGRPKGSKNKSKVQPAPVAELSAPTDDGLTLPASLRRAAP